MADAMKIAAFRLPTALLKRLDKHAEKLGSETGISITRADVVRMLLTRALDAVETVKKKR